MKLSSPKTRNFAFCACSNFRLSNLPSGFLLESQAKLGKFRHFLAKRCVENYLNNFKSRFSAKVPEANEFFLTFTAYQRLQYMELWLCFELVYLDSSFKRMRMKQCSQGFCASFNSDTYRCLLNKYYLATRVSFDLPILLAG